MSEWWNIIVALILFGVWILVFLRQIKKREIASRNIRPNEIPKSVTRNPDEIRELLAATDVNPIKIASNEIELPVLKTSGNEALQLWLNLRSAVDVTGLWPVIVGNSDELDATRTRLEEETEPIEGILLKAQEVDIRKWYRARVAKYPDYFQASEGDWVEDAQGTRNFSSNLEDLTKTPLPEVYLVLVPTKECSQIPAYLQFGGWGNIPLPEENVAILKHWNEVSGAEVVAVKPDTLEMWVSQPPSTETSSKQLAKEHVTYCPDSYAGNTVGSLAPQLRCSTVWHFWWD
jgi:hypothetical protein